jgi:septal ring factor EnvC (AmiA/AmiB activator)
LADSHRYLVAENASLRSHIEEGERRIRALDSQLLAANQRRQDAYKRLDELIAHLDQLDDQLAEAGEA